MIIIIAIIIVIIYIIILINIKRRHIVFISEQIKMIIIIIMNNNIIIKIAEVKCFLTNRFSKQSTDERWTRYNRLYYWTLDNPEEFQQGKIPRVSKINPAAKETRKLFTFKLIKNQIQSTTVISTSVISNNRLSRRENLILVLT